MRWWWYRCTVAVLFLACTAYAPSIPARIRDFVNSRHEERVSSVANLKSEPTHDYYGPSYTPSGSSPYSSSASTASSQGGQSPSSTISTPLSSSSSRNPYSSYGSSFRPSYSTQSSRRDSYPYRPSGSTSASRSTSSAAGGHITEQQRQEARNVISAGNKFGLNLMKYLISENDNTIMAPVSLSIALGMLYFASDGNTMKELSRALHYDEFGLNQNTIMSPLRSISAAGKAANQEGFSFELGNFLFTQKGLNVSQGYKNIINDVFASSVETVDFSRPHEAISHMNKLITKTTHGQIVNPVDSVGPSTRMVLMNAVYFKGFWKQPFSVRSSFDATFANDGVDDVQVRMMYMRNVFLVKSLPEIEADAIQLPYEGDMTVMLILLPKHPQGVNRMLEKLNVVKLIEDLKNYRNESLDLHIPRFAVRGSYRFRQHLHDLGVRDLFTPGAANLPHIDPEGQVILDDVIHEAKIRVDERGTEAVALTTAPIINYSRYPSFNVRHPFVFFVVHKPTGAIFFAGKILRMNADEPARPSTGQTPGSNSRYLGVGRRA